MRLTVNRLLSTFALAVALFAVACGPTRPAPKYDSRAGNVGRAEIDTAIVRRQALEHPPHFYLMRGLSREHGHWTEDFLGPLRTLFPEARITYVDLPGAGRHYDAKAKWSVKQIAGFLHDEHGEALAAYPGNNVLVATSLGGMVALEWLNTYPEAFDAAAFASTGLRRVCRGKERVRPAAKWHSVKTALDGDMRSREQKILAINSNYYDGDTAVLNGWYAIQRERPIRQWALIKQGAAGMFYNPRQRKVSVPVLLLGSEADALVHPACVESVGAWMGAPTYLHPTAGHGLPIDEPAWVVDRFGEWFENIRYGTPMPDPVEVPAPRVPAVEAAIANGVGPGLNVRPPRREGEE